MNSQLTCKGSLVEMYSSLIRHHRADFPDGETRSDGPLPRFDYGARLVLSQSTSHARYLYFCLFNRFSRRVGA